MHPIQGSVDDDCFWEREATGDNESALMYWGLDNMADIVLTTFEHSFSCKLILSLMELLIEWVSNVSIDS